MAPRDGGQNGPSRRPWVNQPALAEVQDPPDWSDDEEEDNDIVNDDIVNDIVNDDIDNVDDDNDIVNDDIVNNIVNDDIVNDDDDEEGSEENEDPEEYNVQLQRDFPELQRQRIRTENAE